MTVVQKELRYDKTLKERTKWKPKDIVKLLRICIETHFYDYEGNIWTQKEGSPMGKSISGVICCIYVANFEKEKIFGNISLIYKPLFWYRSEDDVLCIWEHGINEADIFLDFLNSQHVKVKWTREIEKNKVLPYLDLHLEKVGHKIETGVYRKPTHTLRYSNYRSNRPKDCQLNIIKGLLFRAYNICDAGSKNREAELSLISDAFIACDYPVQRVDSLIQNYTPKSNNNNKKESEDKRNKIFLPYIPKISDTLKQQLNKEGLNIIFL